MGVDLIDWIETIPYAETRNYVQRVWENYAYYAQRLGA
jgi:soluble lytic murein transglycosylase